MRKIACFVATAIMILTAFSAFAEEQAIFIKDGHIYVQASIVEDMAPKAFDLKKTVYFTYGEDRRLDSEAIFGNEWLSRSVKAKEQYIAEKIGDYYVFKIPEDANSAVAITDQSEKVNGFRFNFGQVDSGGKINTWSQIHKYIEGLAENYVYLGKFKEGHRNGLFIARERLPR